LEMFLLFTKFRKIWFTTIFRWILTAKFCGFAKL
jgi:hypothetical protein